MKGCKRSRGRRWIMPLECHSKVARYTVLCSKNCNDLEPSYGIEP
jgi:hypothetical protein